MKVTREFIKGSQAGEPITLLKGCKTECTFFFNNVEQLAKNSNTKIEKTKNSIFVYSVKNNIKHGYKYNLMIDKEKRKLAQKTKTPTINKATDLGNFNCKTDCDNIFISTFEEMDIVNTIDINTLEFNGKKYSMELQTAFESEFNKSKKDFLPNLLWSYHKDKVPTECNINQVLGVPIENLGVVEHFKKELEGKTFVFTADGIKYKIKIAKLAIVGEGFSSFYTLSSKEMLNDTLIIDIGGRTTNIVAFKNKRCVERIQVNKGMIDCYDTIKTHYNAQGNNINTEEVVEYMKKSLIDKSIITDAQSDLINNILRILKRKLNIVLFKIWATGGGSVEMKSILATAIENLNFMNKPLFTNVYGNKKIIDIKWRE